MTFRNFFVGLTSLTLSLAVNSAAFIGVDRAFGPNERISGTGFMRRFFEPPNKEKGSLEFEFVEAPPIRSEKPEGRTRRISNRDALNRDEKGAGQENLPPAAKLGLADQLAQKRGLSAPPPSEPSKPSPKTAPAAETAKSKAPGAGDDDIFVPKPTQTPPSPPVRPHPASSSSPPVPPELAGNAKITTQEMARVKSTGARLRGMTSFEATGSGMGEYMKNLKEKIWLAWFPYLSFKYPFDAQPAAAVISFTIDAKGEVTMVRVVDSEGSPLFASFCMEAVQKASPFPPLPKELLDLIGKDYLEIKFGFHFL